MIEVRALSRDEMPHWLDDLAQLRLAMFRAWPYLYDGNMTYERAYLMPYLTVEDAALIVATDDGRLIGGSTVLPLEMQSGEFCEPFLSRPEPLNSILYGGESVLLPMYRGRGIGARFFDLREEKARALGRPHVTFCSIVRPEDHPARPPAARNSEASWHGRGYRPVPGAVAQLDWRDLGDDQDTIHQLQFWMRTLP